MVGDPRSKLVLFSKMLRDRTAGDLAALARELGVDGYDLCVRPGHPVTPDNVAEALPRVVGELRASGIDVPMITGNFDLLAPDHPTARPVLAAMRASGVGLLKLGYFMFKPETQRYLTEVASVRRALAGWEALAREYGVTVCYHTHSDRCMGLNCAAMAHLLEGLDPACVGAYIDPGHMVVEGEEFGTGVAMVGEYLRIVAVKDVALSRVEKNGHGSVAARWLEAGRGMVDWTRVFERLAARSFAGPVSVHCEFEVPEGGFVDAARREVAFFRGFVPAR